MVAYSEIYSGTWALETSDNFETYLKAVGAGFALRKAAAMAKPTQTITCDDGQWNIQTSTTFKTTKMTFKEGDEFDEKTADGRDVKSVVTMEDGKMVHIQKGKAAGSIIRELIDDGKTMKMTLKVDEPEVVCVRTYSKA